MKKVCSQIAEKNEKEITELEQEVACQLGITKASKEILEEERVKYQKDIENMKEKYEKTLSEMKENYNNLNRQFMEIESELQEAKLPKMEVPGLHEEVKQLTENREVRGRKSNVSKKGGKKVYIYIYIYIYIE